MRKYFLVSYGEFANGQFLDSGNVLFYTTGPTNLDEMRRNVRTYIHKPQAVIVIFHIQDLTPEQYLNYGGFTPERAVAGAYSGL